MARLKLRNVSGRRKAGFGAEAGAILAAAGINVAGTLAGAAIGAKANKDAARQQASAMTASAQRQAQAIREQSEKAREYQQQAQDFMKEQNAENRELQKDIQIQLQMLTGQQNVNDRLEASKIRVKAGGSASSKRRLAKLNPYQRRKLGKQIKAYNNEDYDAVDEDYLARLGLVDDIDYNNDNYNLYRPYRLSAKNGISLLRGGNMPFHVTDGGGVLPVGVTPEGYELYSIAGNDHEHYHKTRGGKNKTGVGIKFANGAVVEGEGNQNSSRGELMLVTPNDAYFISKHSIGGINPTKLVEQGTHPLEAYAIQEQQKAINGISDDGSSYAKHGKKCFNGGNVDIYTLGNMNGPQLGVDTIGDTSVGVAYGVQNDMGNTKRRLRKGGRVQAADGFKTVDNRTSNINLCPYINTNLIKGIDGRIKPINPATFDPKYNQSGSSSRGGGFWNSSNGANLMAAGIGAIGNIGGAFITSHANRSAARTLSRAYDKSANLLADAYRSLRTIDMNSLRRDDFRSGHAMAALQAPISFAANQNAAIDRGLQRRIENAARNSASSAAGQTRMGQAEIDAQDMRDKVYSADQQQMQQIRQANMERLTDVSELNARLDTQASDKYTNAYLNLLQYNNDIENEKILGAANALSEGNVNAANAIAQARDASGQAWASAIGNSSLGFSNSLTAMAKRNADYQNVLVGADTDSKVSAVIMKNDRSNAINLYNSFIKSANDPTIAEKTREVYANYAALLKNRFNF